MLVPVQSSTAMYRPSKRNRYKRETEVQNQIRQGHAKFFKIITSTYAVRFSKNEKDGLDFDIGGLTRHLLHINF